MPPPPFPPACSWLRLHSALLYGGGRGQRRASFHVLGVILLSESIKVVQRWRRRSHFYSLIGNENLRVFLEEVPRFIPVKRRPAAGLEKLAFLKRQSVYVCSEGKNKGRKNQTFLTFAVWPHASL